MGVMITNSEIQNTPKEHYENLMKTLEENSNFSVETISKISGLKPVVAQGAMYQMVLFACFNSCVSYACYQVEVDVTKFNDVADDVEFMCKLLAEESIFILPGTVSTVNFAK